MGGSSSTKASSADFTTTDKTEKERKEEKHDGKKKDEMKDEKKSRISNPKTSLVTAIASARNKTTGGGAIARKAASDRARAKALDLIIEAKVKAKTGIHIIESEIAKIRKNPLSIADYKTVTTAYCEADHQTDYFVRQDAKHNLQADGLCAELRAKIDPNPDLRTPLKTGVSDIYDAYSEAYTEAYRVVLRAALNAASVDTIVSISPTNPPICTIMYNASLFTPIGATAPLEAAIIAARASVTKNFHLKSQTAPNAAYISYVTFIGNLDREKHEPDSAALREADEIELFKDSFDKIFQETFVDADVAFNAAFDAFDDKSIPVTPVIYQVTFQT